MSNVPPDQILHETFPSKAQPYPCKKGCGKSFMHQSSLSRHQKDCSHDSSVSINGDSNTLIQLQGNHNTIENNKTWNVTINITPFSDMSPKLDYNRFVELMKKGALSTILTLIEEHQYNPDKPEQMNMYISNLKDKIGRVFEEHGWKVMDATTLSDDVYNMYQKTVDDLIEGIEEEEGRENIKHMLGEVIGKVEHFSKKWTRSTNRDEFVDHAKKEINLLLYNNRDKVRTAHKLRF